MFAIAEAQLQPSVDGVNIISSPETPEQGADVTVSIESYLIDLDSASIIWMVNDKPTEHGTGIKKIHIKAPKTGNSVVVTANIKSSDGREIRKTIIIKSGSVEIIWESAGYTPPFFKGRNPFVYQNTVKLTAIPHLSKNGAAEVDPRDLIYKWKMGGKYINDDAGYGKQSIEIKTDIIPKPLDISVEIYTRDQSESVTGFLNITPSEPSIELYEMSSLYGILLNKALAGSLTLNNSEISIFAVPFGFNFDSRTGALNYTWSINNVEQPNLVKNQNIVLRAKGDVDGSTDIGLSISGEKEILQKAESSVRINFKKQIQEQNNVTF